MLIFLEVKITGPRTILCDFGVHFEVQFRMLSEEKLFFWVASFFDSSQVSMGYRRIDPETARDCTCETSRFL